MNTFQSAEPFPHVVFDGFAPEETLRAVAGGFDEVPDDAWVRYGGLDEHRKRTCHRVDAMPVACRSFLSILTSPLAAAICEWFTGIDRLQADPSLYGGGLHVTERGGFLGVHLDNERHPTTGLARRLNLVVYCTEGWQPEWGGELELWDRSRSLAKRVEPLWNRAVLFETSAHSFHGHAKVNCPEGVYRKSVAVYYWSEFRARARFFGSPQDAENELARIGRSRIES